MSATETTFDIATLCKWGEAKKIETRNGPRMLRTAPATEKFWTLWRANKSTLQAAGISCAPVKPGSRDWNACWWLPLDPAVVKADNERKAALRVASEAQDAAIEIPSPEGMTYLPYQKAGIQFCVHLFGAGKTGALIGDEMGLGKTIQAIGVINLDPTIKRVLIICPATLKVNWKRELAKWLVRPMRVAIQDAGAAWLGNLADVLIINYDILGKYADQIKAGDWDLRVSDEAHYGKNPKAARSKALYAIPARRKLALTGTPILNRPVELHPILKDLDAKEWGNWFKYVQRYCDAKRNGFGWEVTGASNLDELQARLRGSVMVRRLKKDVLTELPAKRRQIIELDSTGCEAILAAEKQTYEAKEEVLNRLRVKVALAEASDNRAHYESAVTELREGQAALFAEMAKLRHTTVLRKLPQVIGFIQDTLDGNGKLIAFGHHLDAIAELKAKFPFAAVVTGGMSSEQKMEQVDRFQTDPECKLFIGNDAAKEGLTLVASAHVVFFELDWVPGNLSQKEDRAHRIGQKNSVLVTHLVLECSLDATMAKRLIAKQEIIDAALDTGADDYEFETPDTQSAPVSVTVTEKSVRKLASFHKLSEEAKSIDPATIAIALSGLRTLAGMDGDKAQELNDMGFSKIDCRIGHELAMRLSLSPKQGALAVRLCKKYRRQLGDIFAK